MGEGNLEVVGSVGGCRRSTRSVPIVGPAKSVSSNLSIHRVHIKNRAREGSLKSINHVSGVQYSSAPLKPQSPASSTVKGADERSMLP